jgi:hypothetical protein
VPLLFASDLPSSVKSLVDDETLDVMVTGVSATAPLLDGREPVDSDFTLYGPAGIDILPTDRLIIRGLTCNVVGRPFDWRSPFTGWQPGTVIRASIREG